MRSSLRSRLAPAPPLAAALVALAPLSCATSTSTRFADARRAFDAEVPAAPAAERAAARAGDDGCDDGACLAGPGGALDRAALLRAVQARNPTLGAARQAWRAALARVPQASSWDDPMLSYSFAPASVGGLVGVGPVPFGQDVMLSQRLPIPGRLDADGGMALADVELAHEDFRAASLRLAEQAGELFAALYGNARATESNEAFAKLYQGLRTSAAGAFEAGTAGLIDPLRFDVALAHVEHERVVLGHQREDLAARLNALLHRPPKAPLPPPPQKLAVPAVVDVDVAKLVDGAVKARPELLAAKARIERAQAERERAKLAYVPDVVVSGEYDSMWPMPQHQWMVGASLAIPLQLDRRAAAVDEADAHRRGAESEEQALLDQVRAEIEVAHNDAAEAVHVVELYEQKLLPAARAQLEAARASLTAGAAPSSWRDVVDAENEVERLTLAEQLEWAELFRRVAALERAAAVAPAETAVPAGAPHAP